jgi:hypothetical protein
VILVSFTFLSITPIALIFNLGLRSNKAIKQSLLSLGQAFLLMLDLYNLLLLFCLKVFLAIGHGNKSLSRDAFLVLSNKSGELGCFRPRNLLTVHHSALIREERCLIIENEVMRIPWRGKEREPLDLELMLLRAWVDLKPGQGGEALRL